MALTLKLDDIKPLLSAVGLGDTPNATPKPVDSVTPPPMAPPGPPAPTPAAAGFGEWKADPQNQQKVISGMTPPNTPIIPPAANPPQMAFMNPPQQQYASLNPPNVAPAAAPTAPAGPAPLQSFKDWSAANPDQVAKPMLAGRGWKGNLLNIGAAGLVGAAGGFKGDPTAGANWVAQRAAEDRAVPDVNQSRYNAAVVQPQKDMLAARQGAANLSHTEALTGDIATKSANDLAKHGLKSVTDPATGISSVVPDTDSSIYKTQQQKDAKLAQQTELIGAQTENTKAQQALREAQTAFENNKSDPKSLVSQQIASRLATAKQNANTSAGRLNQSQLTYQARYLGTGADGQALPGTMITDDGQSVGSAFSGNVRPTGTERNKGDMAASADEQLKDIKDIMQKNRTMFGPGYGQSSAFKQWLGSQDPDAQRFMAARTIAADHLAGTFGGRSEAALTALDNAIGQFKDNPDAAIAGVDQLTKANSRFEQAGSVRTAGSKAAGATPKGITPPPTGGAPKTYSQTATGSNGHKIGSNDNGNTWFDVQTGKKI